MKVAAILFVLLVVLFGSFFVYTSSTANKLGDCSREAKSSLNKLYFTKAVKDLDDYEKCEEGLIIVNRATECYLSVGADDPVPFDVYERMEILMNPEYQKLEIHIDTHNENCLYPSMLVEYDKGEFIDTLIDAIE
jgi:hypothetical protein